MRTHLEDEAPAAAVHPAPLPPGALLQRYQEAGGFTDCYMTQLPGAVTQAAFIEAFYTSPLFKVERTLLQWLARRPASDADVQRMAAGGAVTFSAWKVEGQTADQLLLADFTGRTRSWLMTTPGADGPAITRIYFGSAVVPRKNAAGQDAGMGWVFHALIGFHRLYSRLLLAAARRRLQASARATSRV